MRPEPRLCGSSRSCAQDQSTQPDNSAQNKNQATTADNQTNVQEDRMTTAKVRKAIAADKDLSTYAHNVKIVTVNGTGPSRSRVRSSPMRRSKRSTAMLLRSSRRTRSSTISPSSSSKQLTQSLTLASRRLIMSSKIPPSLASTPPLPLQKPPSTTFFSGRLCQPAISVLLPDTESTRAFAHQKRTKVIPEGTTTGVAAGGVIGGTLGLLAGIGALAIPWRQSARLRLVRSWAR